MNENELKLIDELRQHIYAAALENATNQRLVNSGCTLDGSVFVNCDMDLSRAKRVLAELLK